MHVLDVTNVHEALPEALALLLAHGVSRPSRNGEVIVMNTPVTTIYHRPDQRVIFWPERDANPFFHFYEALWMLGGKNDTRSVVTYLKRMANYSDDGNTFHGAYGYRWRKHFGIDQLMLIAGRLRKDPDDRRQVLSIWDPRADLPTQEGMRDLPCNLIVTFQIVMGKLDICVFNRSNDIIWGCYGANAVHFSMLHEFMTAAVGVPLGLYYHISVNWHAYKETLEPLKDLADKRWQPHRVIQWPNPYDSKSVPAVSPYPLVSRGIDGWLQDLNMFLAEGGNATGYNDPFFRKVALPMVRTHHTYKTLPAPERFAAALMVAETIEASDWHLAVVQWIERRHQKWMTR